jgi:hypothetical protein
MGLTFAKYAIPEWEGKGTFAIATIRQAWILDLILSCISCGFTLYLGSAAIWFVITIDHLCQGWTKT